MIRFIRHIRAALLFARSYPYAVQVEAVDWRDSDTINCARFFECGSGKKLLLRLEQGVINMALEAAQRGDIHGCGVANGAAMQLAAIRNHSQFPLGPANQPDTEESEAQAALDNFANETA